MHEIDITRWLLGEEIVAATVRAPRSSGQAPDGLVDPQLILLETASGVLVDVEVFVNARYGYDIRCEVVGEQGTLRLAEQEAADFRGALRRPPTSASSTAWVSGGEEGRARGTATPPTRSPTPASRRSRAASAPRWNWPKGPRCTASDHRPKGVSQACYNLPRRVYHPS